MDEQQLQQQIVQLVQAALQGDQQANQQIQQIMQAAQQGDQQAAQLAQMIQQVALQMQQQQVQAAKFGAKLNYIKQLRGVCPDGYEMKYFKAGGRLCKQCVAKQKKMEEGGQVPSNPVDAFKCGRKMKKKENGGSVEMDKCGRKISKKLGGGVAGASAVARVVPRKKIVWSADDPTVGIDPSGAVVSRPREAVGALGRRLAMQQFANDVMEQDQNIYNLLRLAVLEAQLKADAFKNKVFNFTRF